MGRALAVIGLLLGLLGVGGHFALNREPEAAADTAGATLQFERLTGPARTVVRVASNGTIVATLTDGSLTAVLPGRARTFAEPRFTDATVRSATWVRLLPHPWQRGSEAQPWFRTWLDRASGSKAPDVLAVAAQYLDEQPSRRDASGIRYRGDAAFGPYSDSSAYFRAESSDFYDYLGIDWTFPDDDVEHAERRRFGAVDCSGFVRLVYGYRMGLPLLNVNASGPGLPRRAFAMAEFAQGTVIVPNRRHQATDYDRLQPGDLVFFDISGDPQIDHTGIYVGRDSGGHHRFVSSRGRANGPTMGDLAGTALLDDDGYYSRAFRSAKRL